jgi:hypothetical protein
MKVKELVEELQKLDQELPVALIDYVTFAGSRILKIKRVSVEDAEKVMKNLYMKVHASEVNGKFVTIE